MTCFANEARCFPNRCNNHQCDENNKIKIDSKGEELDLKRLLGFNPVFSVKHGEVGHNKHDEIVSLVDLVDKRGESPLVISSCVET